MNLEILKAVFAACGLISALSSPVMAERKPNIIFILADDLGYAELGSYGQKKIRTPHLDRLAKQGMSLPAATPAAPSALPRAAS